MIINEILSPCAEEEEDRKEDQMSHSSTEPPDTRPDPTPPSQCEAENLSHLSSLSSCSSASVSTPEGGDSPADGAVGVARRLSGSGLLKPGGGGGGRSFKGGFSLQLLNRTR